MKNKTNRNPKHETRLFILYDVLKYSVCNYITRTRKIVKTVRTLTFSITVSAFLSSPSRYFAFYFPLRISKTTLCSSFGPIEFSSAPLLGGRTCVYSFISTQTLHFIYCILRRESGRGIIFERKTV